jgi:hypothetical protein
MNFPVTSYVVFVHNGDVGTHAPAFPDWESAEDFANSLRVATSNLVVSEPYPVTAVQEIHYKPRVTTED